MNPITSGEKAQSPRAFDRLSKDEIRRRMRAHDEQALAIHTSLVVRFFQRTARAVAALGREHKDCREDGCVLCQLAQFAMPTPALLETVESAARDSFATAWCGLARIEAPDPEKHDPTGCFAASTRLVAALADLRSAYRAVDEAIDMELDGEQVAGPNCSEGVIGDWDYLFQTALPAVAFQVVHLESVIDSNASEVSSWDCRFRDLMADEDGEEDAEEEGSAASAPVEVKDDPPAFVPAAASLPPAKGTPYWLA